MATLYISEFRNTSTIATHRPPIPGTPALAEQNIGISASSAASAAFTANTHMVMINCDVACSLGWGGAAVTASHRLAANETRFYGVLPGDTVSVIANT